MRRHLGTLALVALLPVVTFGMAWGLDLPGPAGSDPDIWLLSALDLPARRPLYFPPLYPAAVSATRALLSLELVPAGLAVSMASRALLGLLLGLAAGRLGVRPGVGLAAGLVAALSPDLAAPGWRLGPDGLAAAVLAAVALATLGPRGGRAPALVAGLVAACLVREVGVVVTVLVGLAACGQPGLARPQRARALGVLLAALVLAPLLAGLGPEPPWRWPWLHRVFVGTVTAGASVDLPREVPAWARDLAATGTPGLALAQASWSLVQAPGPWVLVALGALGAARARRWTLLALLLSSGAALVTWTAPRHVAVFIPAALVGAMAGATTGRAHRWAVATLLGGLVALPSVPDRIDLVRDEALGISRLRALGEELCDLVQPGAVAAGEPRAFVFCPLPRTALGNHGEEATWQAWVAGTKPAGPGWGRVPMQADAFRIYRYRPDLVGEDRPCRATRPGPATRYFEARGNTVASMSPPCFAPVDDPSSGQRLRHVRERHDPAGPQ